MASDHNPATPCVRPRTRVAEQNASSELAYDFERRMPCNIARPDPAGEGHHQCAAAKPVQPHERIPRERDLEHTVGQYVSDRRGTGGRKQAGECAKHEEFGDLCSAKLGL